MKGLPGNDCIFRQPLFYIFYFSVLIVYKIFQAAVIL